MPKIRWFVCAFWCGLAAITARADEPSIASYSLYPNDDGNLYLTYTLNDPAGKFFESIRDTVRGNTQVVVEHQVTFSPQGNLWGNTAASQKTYGVSYDMLRESYEISEQPGVVSLTTTDETEAAFYLLSVRDLNLVPINQVYAGQAYKIQARITVRVPQESRWARWLPQSWFGKDELNVEALYFAR